MAACAFWRWLPSRHRSFVGLRWPSKRSAALHHLPIRSVWAARCAPMAARSLRHPSDDATPGCAVAHRAAPSLASLFIPIHPPSCQALP
ncbi:hypothetical protein D5045_21230 [Verminephrobacter eiseniae]|nr:hypothetical protein [Verminephrobacter eiseniae]